MEMLQLTLNHCKIQSNTRNTETTVIQFSLFMHHC